MLKLFYHIHTTGDQYGDLFFVDEQIKRLQYSELLEAASTYAVITGPSAWAVWYLVDYSRRIRIMERNESDHDDLYEGRTLRYLWHETTVDDTVIYMHTKGISYLLGPRNLNGSMQPRNIKSIMGWRDVMEQEIIDNWQERLAAMPNYDTQGCYLRNEPFRHYMGNFWWASGRYIRSLPDPMSFEPLPYPGMEYEETKQSRMRYEQWLLLNEGRHHNIRACPTTKKIPGYSTEFTPYEDDVSEL